jgi:hypothetical protein
MNTEICRMRRGDSRHPGRQRGQLPGDALWRRAIAAGAESDFADDLVVRADQKRTWTNPAKWCFGESCQVDDDPRAGAHGDCFPILVLGQENTSGGLAWNSQVGSRAAEQTEGAGQQSRSEQQQKDDQQHGATSTDYRTSHPAPTHHQLALGDIEAANGWRLHPARQRSRRATQ